MNRTLKFAVVAAVAAMGMTSQAHALTNSTTSGSIQNSGSLFLYAFEDRVGSSTSNSLATNSAIFDLGLASAFDTSSSQTIDLSMIGGGNTVWTDYIATIANQANVHWGVFGAAGNGSTAGSSMFTTMSVVPASVNGQALKTAVSHYNGEITLYGTTSGSNVQGSTDLASSAWDDNASQSALGTLTTGLGSNLDFYKYVSTGTKATNFATQTAFANPTGAPDYFTLSNTGVLTYTAPVPEADTYAMMLAGLGLVGFMVRRRKAA